MSCTLCTFKITCWMMELAKKVLDNHQRRRHPRDPDKHLEEGIYNASKEKSEMMLVIDNEEEPADDQPKSVQEIYSNGENIDGTYKEKADSQEDLSQFELMDKIDMTKYPDVNSGVPSTLEGRR